MRKKRMLIMGARGCGKTTLADFLNNRNVESRKTSHMVYHPYTIDAPGAYLECPWMHKHLIATAADASCVLMLMEQNACYPVYPPGFAKAFRIPVLGIITKCDLSEARVGFCEEQLLYAGVKTPYQRISIYDKEGMEYLKKALEPYWIQAEIS